MIEQQGLVVRFAYETLDAAVRQFYAGIDAQIETINDQYRAAIGAIIQQVIDERGKEEALEWAVWRFKKSERTIYRYLQIAEGKNPYPQLRQDNQERYRKDEVLSFSCQKPINSGEPEQDMQQRMDEIHLDIWHQLSPEKQQQATQVMMELAQNEENSVVESTAHVVHEGESSGVPKGNGKHRGGGGRGVPTSEKDGVTRVMRDYQNWQTEKLEMDAGWNCDRLDIGVRDDAEDTSKIILWIENKVDHRLVRIKLHRSGALILNGKLEKVSKKLQTL